MKITLINPPSPFLISDLAFPPLGILYLSSVLKRNNVKVEVVDLAGGQQLPNIETDVVGITSTTPQFPIVCEISRKIKAKKKIIGGPHATVKPNECLKFFDQVVVGEGEKAILKAVNDNTKIIRENFIENLDSIPFPDRDAINIKRYKWVFNGVNFTNIISSRGCPYQCSFCCKVWGSKVRFRSVNNVLLEAKIIRDKYGYNGLMFYDDEMLIDKSRDMKIFQGLKKLGMKFRIFSRVNLVNENVLRSLRECGCVQICFGIESGSNKILKIIRKGFTREHALNIVKLCHKIELSVKCFFIIGLPGETWNTVKETEEFVDKAKPDDVDFTVLTPYPGSDIYNNPSKYDIRIKEGYYWYKGKPGEYVSPVSTSGMSEEEIVEARNYLEGKFKKW